MFCIGHNSYSSSKLSRRFAKHCKAPYSHAEIDVILRFLKMYPTRDLSKYTMYVVRAKRSNSGDWLMGESKPCVGCQQAIKYFGIKEVVYEG